MLIYSYDRGTEVQSVERRPSCVVWHHWEQSLSCKQTEVSSNQCSYSGLLKRTSRFVLISTDVYLFLIEHCENHNIVMTKSKQGSGAYRNLWGTSDTKHCSERWLQHKRSRACSILRAITSQNVLNHRDSQTASWIEIQWNATAQCGGVVICIPKGDNTQNSVVMSRYE